MHKKTKRGDLLELTTQARAIRAAYLREWRKRNRDKQREYERRYWERKANDVLQQEKERDCATD